MDLGKDEAYQKLCKAMALRGGYYPGMDIPEFYELARVLFTPEEAAVASSMPLRASTAEAIAKETGQDETRIAAILEGMADKGLCSSFEMEIQWHSKIRMNWITCTSAARNSYIVNIKGKGLSARAFSRCYTKGNAHCTCTGRSGITWIRKTGPL